MNNAQNESDGQGTRVVSVNEASSVAPMDLDTEAHTPVDIGTTSGFLAYSPLREALVGVLIEIQNMLVFGRLMSYFLEMLCLEMRFQRGDHAEPLEVLPVVVQAEHLQVVVVFVFALRLSSVRVLVEVIRWMAVRKLGWAVAVVFTAGTLAWVQSAVVARCCCLSGAGVCEICERGGGSSA